MIDTSGMSFRFPPELSNKIINYLSDDSEALKACSLASRNLTALSQKLVFSCVVICTPSPSTWQPRSPHVCDLGGSPLKFRALLDTSPHIADYIECLQMINIGPFGDHQLHMYNDSLPHCLPYIHKLKALVICGLHRWDDSSQETWSSILRLLQLPSLIHVDLSAAPDWRLDNALGPNIKHLCIRHDTNFDQHFSSVPKPSISSPIYLESLMTHRSHWSPRHEEFSRIKVSRLRKLVVREVWCDLDGPGTRILLQLCRDSLEELTIIPDLDDIGDIEEYDPDSILDLSKLCHLRILVVHLFGLDDLFQPDYIDWLARLIRASSWPNKTLETFIIRIQYPNKTVKLMEDQWEDVFHSLLGNFPPSLKTLTVLITADEGRDVTSWYNWFNRSKYVRKIRYVRHVDVEVLMKTDLGNLAPLQFPHDARWECVACGNGRRDLVTRVHGLRRRISVKRSLD